MSTVFSFLFFFLITWGEGRDPFYIAIKQRPEKSDVPSQPGSRLHPRRYLSPKGSRLSSVRNIQYFSCWSCHHGKITHRAGPGTAREASIHAKPVPLDLQGAHPCSSASPSCSSPRISCCRNGDPLGFGCLGVAEKHQQLLLSRDECVPLRASRACSFAQRDRRSCSLIVLQLEMKVLWGYGLPLPRVDGHMHRHQWPPHTSGLRMLRYLWQEGAWKHLLEVLPPR